jgi:hypothetical protein
MNLRLKPSERPKPRNAAGESLIKHDPAVALKETLMDAYAERARNDYLDDPRMNSMPAKLKPLPNDVLLIVPAIDILVHEQLTFAERIKVEIQADPDGEGKGRSFGAVVCEEGFHGWTECKWVAGSTVNPAVLSSSKPASHTEYIHYAKNSISARRNTAQITPPLRLREYSRPI